MYMCTYNVSACVCVDICVYAYVQKKFDHLLDLNGRQRETNDALPHTHKSDVNYTRSKI
jgi:hypothetical protein